MLELGRPTHVFDLKRIQSGLTVRWAKPGEQLELLNGQTVQLDPEVGVIVAGDVVESLAGIMGGEATAVTLDTTDIFLEGAFWWPEAIMGRARRFKFSRSEEHTSELQSLMRISYAVFCLKTKKKLINTHIYLINKK